MLRNASLVVGVLIAIFVSESHAVEIDTVTVGNPGNADDTHGDGYGGVSYVYDIGKFEVTAGQYTEFLNSVAATDTYGLYNTSMDSDVFGCQITQNGVSGSYTYDFSGRPSGTEAEWVDRPVNNVSWGSAVRFCNWVHNGQPTGAQDLTTTEDGSYFLNGATTDVELLAIVREPDATWVIPSEDEWYKAAYHHNDGVTGNYYDYATTSDSAPGYVNDSGNLSGGGAFTEGGTDPGNYTTWNGDSGTDGIGSPYYHTNVGEWENSGSPYGTFGQCGNVAEWNEAVLEGLYRGFRGGAFTNTGSFWLRAEYRNGTWPFNGTNYKGFRVAKLLGFGACNMPDQTCGTHLTQVDCEALGGTYEGDGTWCSCSTTPIPALGNVGLGILVATLLAAGGWVISRRTGFAGAA